VAFTSPTGRTTPLDDPPAASLAEVNDTALEDAKTLPSAPSIGRRRRNLAAVAFLVAFLGLGLGVGLGVGLVKNSHAVSAAAPAALPAGSRVVQAVSASLTLSGLSVADFTAPVQQAFVTTVASQLSVSTGAVNITSITDAPSSGRRRLMAAAPAVVVSFTVVPASSAQAGALLASISSVLASDPTGTSSFVAALNAAFAALPNPPPRVTGTLLAPPTLVTLVLPPLPDNGLYVGAFAVDGTIQKGPLIFGSTVFVSELNPDLSSTGAVHLTQTSDSLGSFTVAGGVKSTVVDILADGFYYDEVAGSLSLAPIKLRGFANLSISSSPTINLLTTLQTPRLKTLMGPPTRLSFQAAYTQSQNELLASFGINSAALQLGALASFNLNGTADGSSVMLAVSTLLVQMAFDTSGGGGGSTGALSLLLSNFAYELSSKGVINSASFKSQLSTASAAVDAATVAANLNSYYASLNSSIVLPSFQDFVDADGSGGMPHRVNVVPTAFSLPATTVYAPGANATSNTITVAGMPAGTRAFVRIYLAAAPPGFYSGGAAKNNNGGGSYTPPPCTQWPNVPTTPTWNSGLQTMGWPSLMNNGGFTTPNPNSNPPSLGYPTLFKNGVPVPPSPCNMVNVQWCFGTQYDDQGHVTSNGYNASIVTSAVNGDKFTLSVLSGDYGSYISLILQVGKVTATWNVTTAVPTIPAFSFTPSVVANAFGSASTYGNSITIAGLPTGVSAVALLPCTPPISQQQWYGPSFGSNMCNGGSYFSFVNTFLNGQQITSIAPPSSNSGYSGNMPTVSVTGVSSDRLSLNGVPLGACQVAVQNGDTIYMQLQAPGGLSSSFYNPGTGGFGSQQSIPLTIGNTMAYWNVSVLKPGIMGGASIQLAVGPQTPGNTQAAGGAISSTTCISNVMPSSSNTNYGTNTSLQMAIPFSPSANMAIQYAALGVKPSGLLVTSSGMPLYNTPTWAAVVNDNGGTPGGLTCSGSCNTTVILTGSPSPSCYSSSSNVPTAPTGLFGPATSQGGCGGPSSNGPYSGPTVPAQQGVSGLAFTSYNVGYLDSAGIEVVFPQQTTQLSSGSRYWLVLGFPSNASLPSPVLTATPPAFGNFSLSAAGGGSWVSYPFQPMQSWTNMVPTTLYTLCSPYLYLL
jgi:hypothetical protein